MRTNRQNDRHSRAQSLKSRSALYLAATGVMAAAMPAFATVISQNAADTSQVLISGPKTGANGKNFLDVEGDGNNNNASYGILDFNAQNFGVPTATGINSLTLNMVESNAAFTAPGSVEVYIASDTSANIQPGTSSLTYQFGATPPGVGTNSSQFGTLTDLGSILFNTTGNVNNGMIDSLSLTTVPAAVSNYIASQLDSGGTLRFVLTPNTSSLSATWGGFSNSTISNRPSLSMDITFPPTGQRTLTFNPTPTSDFNFNTVDTNMLDASNASTTFVNGDTVVFPNLNGSASFSSTVTVDAGGVQPALSNFTNTVGTYTVAGGPLGDSTFGAGHSSLSVSGSGAVVLTSNNTYTGGTFIQAGTLIADKDSELGGTGTFANVNISNGAFRAAADITSNRAVQLIVPTGITATGTIDTNGHTVNFASLSASTGGSLVKTGAGTLIFNNNVDFATNRPTQPSTLSILNGAVVLSQPVTAGTGTLSTIFNASVTNFINAPTTAGSFVGNLIIATPIRIDLNAGTIQGGGSVLIDTPGALISDSGGTVATPNAAGIANNIILNRNNVGGLSNGQNLPFTANFGSNGGIATFATAKTSTWANVLNISGVISGNSDVNFGGGSSSSSADGVAGGSGIVLLSAANTYTGATRITTGEFANAGNTNLGQISNSTTWGLVRLGINNALPTTTSVTFGSTSTVQTTTLNVGALDLFGHSQTVTGLASDPNVGLIGGIANFSNVSGGNGAAGTLIINGNLNTTYAGPIGKQTDGFDSSGNQIIGNDSIALQLAATNTGSLQLTAANTYIGGTTISGGTLVVGNSAALGFGSKLPISKTTGSTVINAGGTLELNGNSITEPITLNGGALVNNGGGLTLNDGVKGVGFTAAGSGISGDASISFTGNGSGASATPILGLTTAAVTIGDGGSGYTSAPIVTISGGGGFGAVGTASVSGGKVTGITISNAGSGYTSAPNITVSAPASGTTASINVDSVHFTLVGLQQTNTGSGYAAGATAVLDSSTGAGSAVLTTPAIAAITLQSTSSIGGSGDITVPVVVSGPGGLNKIGTDGATLTANNSYTGGTTVSGGTLSFATKIPNGPVSVAGGALLVAAKGNNNDPSGTSVVTSLSVASGSLLDLANNSMVIDYTGPGPNPSLVDGVRQMLKDGRIFSSSAGTPAHSTIGYGDNAGLGKTSFGGTSVDSSSVLIKFTYAGDANLDGKVDVTDLGALASGWQKSGEWTTGDFNYDGTVDVTDLGILATDWQQGVTSPQLGAESFQQALEAVGLGSVLVPEPCMIGLLAMGSMSLLRRRR